jgi:hypothetical protein
MADDLLSELKKSSKKWANAITQEATKNLGKFSKLIKVKSRTVEQGDGKIGIESTGTAQGTNKKGVKNPPIARAYEYGSGTRSRSKKRSPHQGAGGFITIKAKRKKFLAFYWEKAIADPRDSVFVSGKRIYKGGVDTIPPKARILLGSVQHPGVQAANNGKGYLAPAIAKIRRTMINKELPKDVRKAVFGTIRKGFRVAKK